MAPSGSLPPSASSVSFSLCAASPKPKERLWSKSQRISRGDDSPFPGAAAPPTGPAGASEGTEPACDFEQGLSRSPEPLLTPGTWDPGPQPLGALSCGVPLSCPALHSPSSCGIRFPAPGSSSCRCSETGGGNTSECLSSLPCGQSSTCHLRHDAEVTVEGSDSGRLDFWRRCFWKLSYGPRFPLTWPHYQEGTLFAK